MGCPNVVGGKTCWPLAELAQEWGCTEEDLLWLGVNGKLMISLYFQRSPFAIRQYDVLYDLIIITDTSPQIVFYTGWLELHKDSVFEFIKENGVDIDVKDLISGDKIFMPNMPIFKPSQTNDPTDFTWEVGEREILVVRRDHLRVKQEEVERYKHENSQAMLESNHSGDSEEDSSDLIKGLPRMAKEVERSHDTIKNWVNPNFWIDKGKEPDFPAFVVKIGKGKSSWRVSRSKLFNWVSAAEKEGKISKAKEKK